MLEIFKIWNFSSFWTVFYSSPENSLQRVFVPETKTVVKRNGSKFEIWNIFDTLWISIDRQHITLGYPASSFSAWYRALKNTVVRASRARRAASETPFSRFPPSITHYFKQCCPPSTKWRGLIQILLLESMNLNVRKCATFAFFARNASWRLHLAWSDCCKLFSGEG